MSAFVSWPPDIADAYRRDGYWSGEPLGELTRRWARQDGDRVAVVVNDKRWSFSDIDTAADRVAAGLRRVGLRPGDRVVLQLPNSAEFVYVCIALFRLGVVPVLALPAHRLADIVATAEVSGARALIIPDICQRFDHRLLAAEARERCPGLEHVIVAGDPGPFIALADLMTAGGGGVPGPDADAVAFFLLSGGTTGTPKLIPRTHNDYGYQLRVCASVMDVSERTVYLAALPAAHNAALGCPGVLGTLAAGGRVLMSPTPSPDDVFALVADEHPTLCTVMPSLLALWMDVAPALHADLSGVTLQVGGAILRPELARRALDAGCRLTHWFGMAEGVLACTRLNDPPEIVATTQGRPVSRAEEHRVVDPAGRDVPVGQTGELLARGPMTIRGYYPADPDSTSSFTEDGYLRTGDLVHHTADGNLIVDGRIKDVINRGGEKVWCAEIEVHLESHPGVREAAVVPVPDAALGEKICAFVVPADHPVGLPELRAFLAARGVSDFKLPDQLEIVTALTRSSLGKVEKRRLRALVPAPTQSSR